MKTSFFCCGLWGCIKQKQVVWDKIEQLSSFSRNFVKLFGKMMVFVYNKKEKDNWFVLELKQNINLKGKSVDKEIFFGFLMAILATTSLCVGGGVFAILFLIQT